MLSNIHQIPSLRVDATSALDEGTTKKIQALNDKGGRFSCTDTALGSALRLLARWIPVSNARPDSGDSSCATRIFLNIFDSLLTLGSIFNINIGFRRSPDQDASFASDCGRITVGPKLCSTRDSSIAGEKVLRRDPADQRRTDPISAKPVPYRCKHDTLVRCPSPVTMP
jgi:hypothetical protein